MYYVYIIENESDSSWYIGYSTDVERRLSEHVGKIGGEYTKKKSGGWKLLYIG